MALGFRPSLMMPPKNGGFETMVIEEFPLKKYGLKEKDLKKSKIRKDRKTTNKHKFG